MQVSEQPKAAPYGLGELSAGLGDASGFETGVRPRGLTLVDTRSTPAASTIRPVLFRSGEFSQNHRDAIYLYEGSRASGRHFRPLRCAALV